MTIVKDSQCPACAETGHDSTSNHLLHYDDGGKYCPKAEYHKSGEPYYEPPEAEESFEDDSNMDWLKYTPDLVKKTVPYGADPSRCLSEETIKYFGLKAEFSTSTGEIDKVFYPYYDGKELGYKIRKHFEEGDREVKKRPELLGKFKCFRAVGNVKGSLFNQTKVPASSKNVLLVEGEEDAPAAYEMLKKYNPRVLSIPSGASLDKDGKGVLDKAIIENLEYLRSHESLTVCFDQDKAGQAITEELARLIGPKVKVMQISEKDASDMLKKGKAGEFINAFFSAKKYKPQELITVDDAWEEATTLPEFGRPWPWPTLTKLTYGRRDGQGIYVGAGVKVGKTEWLSEMVHHIIHTEGRPVFLAKFEQGFGETLKAIAGKMDKVPYNNPEAVKDGRITQEKLDKAIERLREKVYLFNAGYSDAGEGDLWERMKGVIRYLVIECGVKDIFIDPITQLTDGQDHSQTDVYLRKFSNEIQALSQELGFFYYIFCHLKEPGTGPTHEEGGRVKSAQFRGSRAMQEKTKFMLGIRRDITAEDEQERNTSIFELLLASVGKTGNFPVIYNPETTSYLEPEMSLRGDY